MRHRTSVVTGVAGFIGSHLAERLIREGHFVIGIDCFADYYPRWMKERNLAQLRVHERFRFVEADLLELDLEALFRSLEVDRYRAPRGEAGPDEDAHGPVDYIYHLAAQAGVRASWGRSFEVYVHNNVLATQRLLEAAKGLRLKKLVYASSSSIYGDAEAFPTAEAATPRPVSPYGVTKLAAEHLTMLYWRNYGLPVAAVRYFTVYGPRQRPDMAFHRFIRAIIEGDEILVYGDGEQTRDFTYVSDAVDGTCRAASAAAVGEVFNIGGGSRVSVNEVLRQLEAIVGRRAKVRHTMPSHGDVRHTSADTRRARERLSYVPRTTLADGLLSETEWLKDNLGEPIPQLASETPTVAVPGG